VGAFHSKEVEFEIAAASLGKVEQFLVVEDGSVKMRHDRV
jgi:hypothetical protein